MKLLIGNRNYSTWSLRPWLVLRHFEIPFEDEVLLLCGNGWRENLQMRSPTGKVPVLIDGDLVLLNAAAALVVADRAASLVEGVEIARESIDSGAALEKVEALVRLTNA